MDKTQEDARQKLKNIVALAYDSLHAELKARFLVDRANAGEFGVRFHEVQRVAHMLNKDYIATAATICRTTRLPHRKAAKRSSTN